MGGGARPDEEAAGERFGAGPRVGGVMRLLFREVALPFGIEKVCEGAGSAPRRGGARAPPEALCAELRAGKEGGGMRSLSVSSSPMLDSARAKEGTIDLVEEELVRGVVGEGIFLKVGGGGGGIAFRSSSSFEVVGSAVVSIGIASCLTSGKPSSPVVNSIEGPSSVISLGASSCFFPVD